MNNGIRFGFSRLQKFKKWKVNIKKRKIKLKENVTENYRFIKDRLSRIYECGIERKNKIKEFYLRQKEWRNNQLDKIRSGQESIKNLMKREKKDNNERKSEQSE